MAKNVTAAILLLFSGVVFSYTWIYYPIAEKHTGDFLNQLRGGWSYAHTWIYWDGEGIDIYGPWFSFLDYWIHESGVSRLTASRMLFIFHLALNVVSSFLLLKIFRFWEGTALKKTIGIFLIVNFFPLIQALKQNVVENVQFFTLVLFLFFFIQSSKRRYKTTAVALGVGISAKTFPIILIPYLFLRRKYKITIGALGVFAAIVMGVSWLKQVSFSEGLKGIFLFNDLLEGLNYHCNQALSGFIYRLFVQWDYSNLSSLTHPILTPKGFKLFQMARYATVVLCMACVGWSVLPSFRKTWVLESKKLMSLEVFILFSMLLLALPHTQTYYFVLILPAYLYLFSDYFSKPGLGAKKILLVLSYFLIGIKLPFRILEWVFPSPVACPYIQLTNLWNFPFYGLVILTILLITTYRQQCHQEIHSFVVGSRGM